MHIHTRSYTFGTDTVRLQVPELRQEDRAVKPPYWTRLWPAALALAQFIAAHPALVAHKTVLELAAGLGLPGIVAARFARAVTISDYVPDAVALMQASANLNGSGNIRCRCIDWAAVPPDCAAEVLLLSDVNYEPAAFPLLYEVLAGFLRAGTTVILATPQRLMAKPFIEQLLPWCIRQEEEEIRLEGEQAYISILILHSRSAVQP